MLTCPVLEHPRPISMSTDLMQMLVVNQWDDIEPGSESEVWDLDNGLKPTQSDSDASDDDVEVVDLLPEEEEMVAHNVMVNMMVGLEDGDAQDFKWLPPKECKRTVPKKKGIISFAALDVKELTMRSRKTEGALSWP